MVKIASGKNKKVGASSKLGGRTYTVQSDGSVKRDDGKITAKATGEASTETKKAAPKKEKAPTPATKKKAPQPRPASERPKKKEPVKGLIKLTPGDASKAKKKPKVKGKASGGGGAGVAVKGSARDERGDPIRPAGFSTKRYKGPFKK